MENEFFVSNLFNSLKFKLSHSRYSKVTWPLNISTTGASLATAAGPSSGEQLHKLNNVQIAFLWEALKRTQVNLALIETFFGPESLKA